MWNKLSKHYKFLIPVFGFLMVAVANWNQLTEFYNNYSAKLEEPFIIKQQLGINYGFNNTFYYLNKDTQLNQIGYMSYITLTNNLDRKTKLTSIKLEIELNDNWTELFLIEQNISSNGFFKQTQPGVSSLQLDTFYIARNGNPSISKSVSFYNFESIARIKNFGSGETLNGWLLFSWPSSLNNSYVPKFSSIRYTLNTIQGVEFSKIIDDIKLEKKLGNMTNYYASAWSIKNDTIDLMNRVSN